MKKGTRYFFFIGLFILRREGQDIKKYGEIKGWSIIYIIDDLEKLNLAYCGIWRIFLFMKEC